MYKERTMEKLITNLNWLIGRKALLIENIELKVQTKESEKLLSQVSEAFLEEREKCSKKDVEIKNLHTTIESKNSEIEIYKVQLEQKKETVDIITEVKKIVNKS